MADYSEHFLIRGKDVSPHAADYLSGLLGTYRRKNMECIHGTSPTVITRASTVAQ